MVKKIIKIIGDFFKKRMALKIAALAIALCFIVAAVLALPMLSLKETDFKKSENTLLAAKEKISSGSGEVKVASNGGMELYVNPDSMEIKVKDQKSGKEWSSVIKDAKEGKDKALINISYLGKDNSLKTWNSYDNCTAFGSYEIFKVENGVQIKMNLNEGESTSFYEYFPQKIPVERFEQFIVKSLKDKIENKEIDRALGEKYLSTLSIIYKKSPIENCYAVNYKGSPPKSAVKQMIQISKEIGYTHDMLVEDSEQFGLPVSTHETASFYVTMEVLLENGELYVNIPSSEISTDNDYYQVQNIEVLPNFGAVSVQDGMDGYILVPDGCGALMKFNTYNPVVPDYIRPFYDNNYYSDYYFMSEYKENLMMPVYGMIYGENGENGGFMAIISNGADTSYMNVKLAGESGSGSLANKAYASFDCIQYSRVKIYGAYSDNAATYLASTGKLDINWQARYKFYSDKVSYFDMAKDFKGYLMEQSGIKELSYSDDARIYLETVGTLSLTKRIFGIPYESEYSMTTYDELEEILKDLQGVNLSVQYDGAFNGGLKNYISNRAELVSLNGSKKDFENLETYANGNGIDLFLNVNFARIGKQGKGFWSRFGAVYDYYNSPAKIYRYDPALGIMDGDGTKFFDYVLSPKYLDSVVDGFISDSSKYGSISVGDLAGMFYADYRYGGIVQPGEASASVLENLKKLSAAKKLALNNPRAEYAALGGIAANISRESGDYASFYATVPFRQLVLNGLCRYTTENANMSSEGLDYYLLQGVELGSLPKFMVSAKSVDVLQNSNYSYLYSMQYDNWKDEIKEVYGKFKDAMAQIGTNEITGHQMLAKNVFCTEYASGTKVITNYNKTKVDLNGKTIEAMGYLIIPKGGKL